MLGVLYDVHEFKVRWMVVGLIPITVVDLHPSRVSHHDAMLVGFHIGHR